MKPIYAEPMIRVVPALLLLSTLLVGCDSSDPEEIATYFQAQLSLEGMTPLDGGASYEAWARLAGQWQSLGRFNFDVEGRMVDAGGRLIASTFISQVDLAPATEILISIEGRRDADLIPSNIHVLRGAVVGTAATVTFAEAVEDLSIVTSLYTIGTPTDLDPSNEEFGVWLASLPGYQPAMVGPNLGGGWQYELWLELPGGPVSLGTFTNPGGRDAGSPFSSDPETFSAPGEDFLENPPSGVTFPLAAAGQTIFVSVEPVPDDFEDTPFGIRLLEANIPASATPGQELTMTQVNVFPTGTVQFR